MSVPTINIHAYVQVLQKQVSQNEAKSETGY